MHRTIILAPLVALLASGGTPAAEPRTRQSCSIATLEGQYIFTGRGFIEPLEPGIERAHYGVFVFDGHGGLVGKQTSSRGGNIGRENLEGTYVLDADCSGRMTFTFVDRPDSATHWDMYVTADGKTGHIIRTDDGTMAVRTFEK